MRTELGECPDPNFKHLSRSVRRWRPDFEVGDRVVHKLGTLGNMDGRAPSGIVTRLYWRGTHIMAEVMFSDQTENFAASTYTKQYRNSTKRAYTSKPVICVDFDGVIHSYELGWQAGEIYGTAVPGFFEWLDKAQEYFRIVIYSSRSKTKEGRAAMNHWLERENTRYLNQFDNGLIGAQKGKVVEFVCERSDAFLTIDDRSLTFNGDWYHETWRPEKLLLFRSWTQLD